MCHKNVLSIRVRKLLRMGLALARAEVEEADAGNSKQERAGVVIFFHGGEYFGC